MDEVVKATSFWILLALLAASLEPVVVKMGYRDGITPWQMLFLKNLFATLAILPVTRFVARGQERWRWIGWAGVATVATVSLQLMVTNLCSLLALSFMPAITVITLMTSTPAFVALVNQRQGRERLTASFWFGLALCVMGVALSLNVLDQGLTFDPWGLVFVAGSVLSSTIYRTRMEGVTQAIPPLLVSTYLFLINGTVSLLLILPFLAPIASHAYGLGAWVGTAAAVANVAFLYALARVGSTNMSIFNLLQRPLVLLIAALALREPLTALQIAGTVLVLIGVRFAQVKRP
jgi:drug/metabolite transporter (DMT)-like permease